MTNKEIREKSVEELSTLALEMKQKLFALRFQNSTGQLENPGQIVTTRRIVAKILTVIQEKEFEILKNNLKQELTKHSNPEVKEEHKDSDHEHKDVKKVVKKVKHTAKKAAVKKTKSTSKTKKAVEVKDGKK